MSRDITNDDLLKVKRMGPGKAEEVKSLIADTPNPAGLTADDFAAIQGVSQHMGEELVKLVKDPDSYTPEAPTPRKPRKAAAKAEVTAPAKKATRKRTAKKATTKRSGSNGHGKVKAGEVRLFARDAERLGLTDVATDLRNRVSALNDEETVAKRELVNS